MAHAPESNGSSDDGIVWFNMREARLYLRSQCFRVYGIASGDIIVAEALRILATTSGCWIDDRSELN